MKRKASFPLLLIPWVVSFAIPAPASGHQLDEYLQATLVDIRPGDIRLKINLTPGINITRLVLGMIDRNQDGSVSTEEAARYGEIVKRGLGLRFDGHAAGLNLTTCNFPELDDLRDGSGIIQLEFSASPAGFSAGNHSLAFENQHIPALGVFLFNAAKPESDQIQILSQSRNENQSNGRIDFSFHPPPGLPQRSGVRIALVAMALALALAMTWHLLAIRIEKPIRC